ncbi:hypothetical protein BAX55_16010 [Acinetobacter baumannii]|uniref:hypothetical protein n=1 Tax=Acinetobacter baumannii TaxID=470 RepID=UPI0007EE3812|nr:hypothetical protein [Acinetobacter baumannii]OBS04809.1 hypothetical protein BAX55_16010 [Acinetobacter baumannii]
MRKEAIDDLLIETNELIEIIRTYRKISKPKVKSIFEHLRSVLEYLAQDINDKLSSPSKRLYFPYGNTLENFENSIKKNLPLLRKELPDIYLEIKKIQNFSINDDWLLKLCKITNEAKHNNAINVKHDEEIVKEVQLNINEMNIARISGKARNIVFKNVKIGGKDIESLVINEGNIEMDDMDNSPLNFKITKDRKILIGDELLDLFPFLDKCISSIKSLIFKIYSILK